MRKDSARSFAKDLQVLRSIGLEKRVMEQAERLRRYEWEEIQRAALEAHWRQLRWFLTGMSLLAGMTLVGFGLYAVSGSLFGVAFGLNVHTVWLRLQRKGRETYPSTD